MEQRGTPLRHSPILPSSGGKALDLFKLYHVSVELGGYKVCSENNSWRHVAVRMETTPKKAFILKNIYSQYLLPYEEHLKMTGGAGGMNNTGKSFQLPRLGPMFDGNQNSNSHGFFPPQVSSSFPSNKKHFKKKNKKSKNVFHRLGNKPQHNHNKFKANH